MATHATRDDIRLLDGAWYATEPHGAWTWMREHAPAYWDEQAQVWGITRYEDVMAIERDPKTFSNKRSPRPHGGPLPMMISMDDPAHYRRRNLVNRGFTPRRIADRGPQIRAICDQIIDRVCERGECDFVWDIAAPLPLLLIGDMLGFERDAYDDLLRWSDDLMRGTSNSADPDAAGKAGTAMMDFRAYQLGVIADRRARPPQDDLISVLCHAEIDGERLDDESLVMETLLILIGGDETTRHVISGGMLAFLDHQDQWDRLRNDRLMLDSAVEELLRWVTPIKNMSRTVTRDLELHGQQLREEDQLILLYPSANRDEEIFDDPFTFDITRDPNHHLAFGFGAHFCLGNALARLELKTMFDRLADRMPDVALASGDPLPYRHSNFIVGPEAMPVTFTPTPRAG